MRSGSNVALLEAVGFKTLKEIRAYQAIRALKLEVYRLVAEHPAAARDLKYRDQLFEAGCQCRVKLR